MNRIKFNKYTPIRLKYSFEYMSKISLCIISIIILAAPLFFGRPSMFQDWPNHISRIHIINNIFKEEGFWSEFYEFRGFFVPNSVADISITSLVRLGISPSHAEIYFLIFGFFIFVRGFCISSYSVGSFDASKPIFAAIFFIVGL